MSLYYSKDLPQIDLDALRKGRCPWCLQKLTPVFESDEDFENPEHTADECLDCGDRFQ